MIRDPNEKLQTALDILEQFTKKNPITPISHISQPPNQNRGMEKIIQLAKCFVSATLSEQSQEQEAETLFNAIEDVKRYHPLVCHKENPESQILSKRAHEAITEFNQVLEFSKTASKKWSQRLLQYLIRRNHPSLANVKKITLSGEDIPKYRPEQIAEAMSLNPMTIEEEDAFKMKAISKVRDRGTLFPFQEILKKIHETPIHTSLATDASKSSLSASTVLFLPWETLILKGTFKRDPNSLTPSIPISESFELKTVSSPGFPDPSLHTGSCFSDKLLPKEIGRPESLPYLSELLQKKQEIARGLQERSELFTKAKKLLQQKLFEVSKNQKQWLELQECFFGTLVDHHHDRSVKGYFSWLSKHPSPYAQLSGDLRQVLQEWINAPSLALERAWINQDIPELLSNDPNISLNSARQFLNQELRHIQEDASQRNREEKAVLDFQYRIGNVLASASHHLILQSFSEMIELTPPKLSPFEKAIQSIAFFQLHLFCDALEKDPLETSFEKIEKTIEEEIKLLTFQAPFPPIVTQLEHYFSSRLLHQ